MTTRISGLFVALALFGALSVTSSFAQDKMSKMSHKKMAHSKMAHKGKMAHHGKMTHSKMAHGKMTHKDKMAK